MTYSVQGSRLVSGALVRALRLQDSFQRACLCLASLSRQSFIVRVSGSSLMKRVLLYTQQGQLCYNAY